MIIKFIFIAGLYLKPKIGTLHTYGHTPMNVRIYYISSVISYPYAFADPLVNSSNPVSIEIVFVLPAPF